MIKAVTFDLWDTVIHDDSDEPKRAAKGLASKKDTRRQLVLEALSRSELVEASQIHVAYDAMESAFHHVWHRQHITWTVAERMEVLLSGLGRSLPEDRLSDLITALEEMEITVAPDPIDGIGDAIAALGERYKLGVVSDAIYTPGRCLRKWLEMHDLKRHFGGFAFSDEVGYSKPHRNMFASVAEQLDVRIDDMAHIGDRDHNDIKGPQALGMKAVLFTATRDRDKDHTSADAICGHANQIVEAIDRLAAK
jgi:putative hydrolase of the HAD superfamily